METWTKHEMGDAVLVRTTKKNLRGTFSADIKVSEQCRIAASNSIVN